MKQENTGLFLKSSQTDENLQKNIAQRLRSLLSGNRSQIEQFESLIDNLCSEDNLRDLSERENLHIFLDNLVKGLIDISAGLIDNPRYHKKLGDLYEKNSVNTSCTDIKKYLLKKAAQHYNSSLIFIQNEEKNHLNQASTSETGIADSLGMAHSELEYLIQRVYNQYWHAYSSDQEPLFCAKSYREKLNEIRTELKKNLEEINKEEDIKKTRLNYNEKIQEFHKEMIKSASFFYDYDKKTQKYRHDIELLSLGSVAQKYATAYSDIEIAVLTDKEFNSVGTPLCDDKNKEEIRKFIELLHFHYQIIGEEVTNNPDGFRIGGTTIDPGSLEKIYPGNKGEDMSFVNDPEGLACYWINSIFEKNGEGSNADADKLVILRASPLFSTNQEKNLYKNHQEKKKEFWTEKTNGSQVFQNHLPEWTQKFVNYMETHKKKTEAKLSNRKEIIINDGAEDKNTEESIIPSSNPCDSDSFDTAETKISQELQSSSSFEVLGLNELFCQNQQNNNATVFIDLKSDIFQPVILWIMYVSFFLGYIYFSEDKPPTIDNIIEFIDSKKIFSDAFINKLKLTIEKVWFLKCLWELKNEFKVEKESFLISFETIEKSKQKYNLEGEITKFLPETQKFVLLLIESSEAIKNFFITGNLPEKKEFKEIFSSRLTELVSLLNGHENEFAKKIINQAINIDDFVLFFPKNTQQKSVYSITPILITTYSTEISSQNKKNISGKKTNDSTQEVDSNEEIAPKYIGEYIFPRKYCSGFLYPKINQHVIYEKPHKPHWNEGWCLIEETSGKKIWGLLNLKKILEYISIESTIDSIEPYFSLIELYKNKIFCLFFIGRQKDFDNFIDRKKQNRQKKDLFLKKISFYQSIFGITLINSKPTNTREKLFFDFFNQLSENYSDTTEQCVTNDSPRKSKDLKKILESTAGAIIPRIKRTFSTASNSSDDSLSSKSSFDQKQTESIPEYNDIFDFSTLSQIRNELKDRNKQDRYEYIISKATYTGSTLFHFLLENNELKYENILLFFSFFDKDDVLKILCKKTIYGYTPIHYLMRTKYQSTENKKLLRLILYYFDAKSLHELSDQFSILSHTPMHFFLLNSDARWDDDDFELIVSFIEEENLHNFFWQKENCLFPILCLVLKRCRDFNLILYIFQKIIVDINEIISLDDRKWCISDFIDDNENLEDNQKGCLKDFLPLAKECENELQRKKTELNNKKEKFNQEDKLEIFFLILQEKIKNELSEMDIKENIREISEESIIIEIESNIIHSIFFLLMSNYSEEIVENFLNILHFDEYKYLLILLKEEKTGEDALYFSAKKENRLFSIFMNILLEKPWEAEKNSISTAMSYFLAHQKENIIEYFFSSIREIEEKDKKYKIKTMIEEVAGTILNEERKIFINRNLNRVFIIHDTMKALENKKNDTTQELKKQNEFIKKLSELKEKLLDLNNQTTLEILEEKISKVRDNIKEKEDLLKKYGVGPLFSSPTLFYQTCSSETDTLQPSNNF